MLQEASCTFQITQWDETPYQELADGAKLTRVKTAQLYRGAIAGTSACDYLMAYTAGGAVSFVGIEVVTGFVDGKAGGFVIQHSGIFSGGQARSTWNIVEGSGEGQLLGIHGCGSYLAGHGKEAQVMMRYGL